MKLHYGKFKFITVFYTAVLNSTSGMAFAYAVANRSAHAIVLATGLFFFLMSDLILSGTYFSQNEKDRSNRVTVVLNHAAYYLAQFLIASSLILY